MCFPSYILVFGVCSPSSVRKQALLYLFCRVVALGSQQATEFTSEDLNEESLMKGLLQTYGQGYENRRGVAQLPGTSSNGKPLPSPGQGTKGANSGEGWQQGHQTGNSCKDTEVKQGERRENNTSLLSLHLSHLCLVPPLVKPNRKPAIWLTWAGEVGQGCGCLKEGGE